MLLLVKAFWIRFRIARSGGPWYGSLIVIVISSSFPFPMSPLESVRPEWEKATCERLKSIRSKEFSPMIGKQT